MNYQGLIFITLLTVISTFSVNATERTLTDTKGRTIDVTLLAKNDNSISVIRSDGLELEINYDLLSSQDREFISQWEPPEPELPESPIDAVVLVSTTESSGSGFFAHDQGKTYLYTNQHVISDIFNVKATDSKGNPVELGELEISNKQDIARFKIRNRPAFLITDTAEPNEEITVLGNSEGAGVITNGNGKIKGIGPFEIEVDADFVPGNSGGPVVNSENSVIGIATYISKGDEKPDWVSKDTRYAKARRFTIRPSRIKDWRKISREEYAKQISNLKESINLFNQIYWTYLILAQGKGYISDIPENWHRNILQILRNHNSRQKRPDATQTTYYVGGYYTSTTTTSHTKKKEASRRANLRALMRVIEDEFGNSYKLKKNQIDIEYLLKNKYESSEILEEWLASLKEQINNNISASKSSY
jgi:hypothetical protein